MSAMQKNDMAQTNFGRSKQKRRTVLQSAEELFLTRGFNGTSMDEVAVHAGVSKQTVYKHFADKERLFSEVVTSTVNEASDPVHACATQNSADVTAGRAMSRCA